MKAFAKQFVLFCLERLAHWRLRKIHPQVIGITGSVGKTSTKEAVFRVVSQIEPAYCNKGSLNSDFGAMLAILEQDSGYSSPSKWLKALGNGFWSTLWLRRPPYQTLVLEMGADKPGDISYLVKHIPPEIGILTTIKAAHLAEGQFPTVEAIVEEKSKLIRALPSHGVAILNTDDPRVAFLASEVSCRVVRFGVSADADVRASQVQSDLSGLRFTVHAKGQTHGFHLPHLLGTHQIYVVLPAIAVGLLKNIPLATLSTILEDFVLPPGRLNRLEGLHGSTLLDSSYNASPEATVAALDVLKTMPGRRIAALGAMNELGALSKAAHLQVGHHVAETADLLLTVGKAAEGYAEGARKAGMPARAIRSFATSLEAAEFLVPKLKKTDVVLAKGSQNKIRMEHLVQALLKDPSRAKDLLVRQESYWKTH